MANKMLIDSTHTEETRVVVVRGNRVEEFDFESASKKQLRGNIYLAKVTRVEPSLQAAFVDYGGNRHGFLAFSEIHPDYYQIPTADRQALLDEEAEGHDEQDEGDGERAERKDKDNGRGNRRGRGRRGRKDGGRKDSSIAASVEDPEIGEDLSGGHGGVEEVDHDDEEVIEAIGGTDAMEESERPQRVAPRRYKIQEVIKRRQVLLVQVVKEERGNKGAALTTYLSLAGRYCVLMPNTGRGGGISRKITNPADRKRLKTIAQELEVPDGMGVILRTAGASRTKAEVKRDFEYLQRLWETVADLTMKSQAPMLVYEEGSLVKRAIRDLYNKDIDEVLVAGETGYREAKDFMRMLMPSHAKNVQPYREQVPIFTKHGIESQLDLMFSPQVQLKSGGYIVLNQTEALVSIDVNSGRSTKEHNIEDTALKTNLEAAEEVARQLRLRDLAGLVVIDFIDMEENRNNRAVERKLKDCLKQDRARIQVGRISHFGLLEMSRQRIRASVLESTMENCHHCHGTGYVRSPSSSALQIIRMLEERLIQDSTFNLVVRTRTKVALYVLNQKRTSLRSLEERFGVNITIDADDHLPAGSPYVIDRADLATGTPMVKTTAVTPVEIEPDPIEDEIETIEETGEGTTTPATSAEGTDSEGRRRRRRRRRRRGGGRDQLQDGTQGEAGDNEGDDDEGEGSEQDAGDSNQDGETAEGSEARTEGRDGEGRRRRRRGRRGGRRERGEEGVSIGEASADEAGETEGAEAAAVSDVLPEAPLVEASEEATTEAVIDEPAVPAAKAAKAAKPRAPRSRKKKVEAEIEAETIEEAAATPATVWPADTSEEPTATAPVPAAPPTPVAEEVPAIPRIPALPELEEQPKPAEQSDKPRRFGWWSKK